MCAIYFLRALSARVGLEVRRYNKGQRRRFRVEEK
jgi:hypothetical protein